MKLRWSIGALTDLDDIAAYIAADDPIAAAAWIERLHERAAGAARIPGTGRVVPEFGRPDIREVLLRSYRIVYRAQKGAILVLAVREGHQRLPHLSLLPR